ncbi:hypothetical protein PSQ90_05605 [Devosia rhodophyticola]|uniref:Lipoprotein n=1 Tax=Devosia rhodophyticola TaxID=3026423 RepID=A0ABY7YZX0_9HYPH|nr:hypothetical protein [Devosia rhodophyticola]WDR06923.1 hypothetical protein PSQ90_05605 [Devosia rhodophyticola]
MTFLPARIVATAGSLLFLAGCVDATVDIDVISPTTARASMTQVMGAEFYSLIKPDLDKPMAGTADGKHRMERFCAKGELVENADGSAACYFSQKGDFATILLGRDQQRVRFTPLGDGLVRVELSLVGIAEEVGAHRWDDEKTRQMNQSLFSGHTCTLRFGGLEVVDTNMSLSPDKRSAEQVVHFLDLINGTAGLPATLYAVVRVK